MPYRNLFLYAIIIIKQYRFRADLYQSCSRNSDLKNIYIYFFFFACLLLNYVLRFVLSRRHISQILPEEFPLPLPMYCILGMIASKASRMRIPLQQIYTQAEENSLVGKKRKRGELLKDMHSSFQDQAPLCVRELPNTLCLTMPGHFSAHSKPVAQRQDA